jgi:hypothetical protein
LSQFAGQSNSGLGQGEGGDMTVTLSDGGYELVGRGEQPMALQLKDGGGAGKLYVKGTIKGTYDEAGAVRKFSIDTAKGNAYLTNDEGRADIEFGQLTKILGLDGQFAVACAGDRVTLAGPSAVFYLSR